jgi:putative colanic acid biosynthesis acetyltransferase WcaF
LLTNKTDLSTFQNRDFSHGKSLLTRMLWILCSSLFFETVIPYTNAWKSSILRLFGAKIGKGVVLKPSVKIKQPWRLEIGDHSWIGEGVWIDNLVQVSLASNVCLSQGAFLLTGNHNYKKTSFDLITGEIHLEEGVWIGAKSIVGPGVICHSHAVLAAGSSAFKHLEAYCIYQGNPGEIIRKREIK